jgi:hypothetical protein
VCSSIKVVNFADLKKTLAVLLENILERLDRLESKSKKHDSGDNQVAFVQDISNELPRNTSDTDDRILGARGI